ncbi:MAG: type VII secretion-associated serine protease mycosin [Micromonosporaceae bacterium]
MRSDHPTPVTKLARSLAVVACAVIGIGVGFPSPAAADEIRDKQWHLDYLDIAKAHEITRGEGVTVAILDSGVDYRHPDLKGALLEGKTYAGGRSDGWEDADGHGTAMAALVAGRGHGPRNRDGALGVAPAAKILPVRTENGKVGDSRGLQQGIEWAADHGADILSISQGFADNPDIAESVNYAINKGVVIVASAGNTAKGETDVVAPARYPGVIAVSGSDHDGNFTDEFVSGPQVVLSAPATDVASAGGTTGKGYGSGTGTSPAAAIAAGVAALVKAKYPDLDAANVINRLIRTADDRGPEGRDSQYGFGVVDPVAALTDDVPAVKANPLIKPSGSASKPPAEAKNHDGAGIGPAGYGLIAIGTLGAVTLAIVALIAVNRRRRIAPANGPTHHGQVRPPTPPHP